jgi:integrase
MSIEVTATGYRVRWRDASGRNRAKSTGPRKGDATTFEQETKRAQRLGILAGPDTGAKSLKAFSKIWARRHISKLAPSTQKNYADLWDRHVLPHLGGYRLREIRVSTVEEWIADLEAAEVPRPQQQKALTMLGACLEKALAWEELAGTNAARHVTRPTHRKKAIVPLDPIGVEAIRSGLLAVRSSSYKHGRLGDATMVSVVAYAGLRVPSEIIDLTWNDIRDRTILVNVSSKTGQTRAVDLLAPLAADLNQWRLACGRPFGDAPVFPGFDGEPWTKRGYAKWRQRIFKPLAPEGVTPYGLRHTYVSLLIREGRKVVDVAEQAGHSPKVCLDNYAHLFAELDGAGSAEDAIREARSGTSKLADAAEG